MVGNVVEKRDDDALVQLISEHRQFKNQPLHLAVAYRSSEVALDLFLLEVADNFAGNEVSDKRLFMKVWVAQSPEFTVRDATDFYLLLTNPNEFERGLKQNWPQVRQLRDSVKGGRATAYFKDSIGERWWNQISGT